MPAAYTTQRRSLGKLRAGSMMNLESRTLPIFGRNSASHEVRSGGISADMAEAFTSARVLSRARPPGVSRGAAAAAGTASWRSGAGEPRTVEAVAPTFVAVFHGSFPRDQPLTRGSPRAAVDGKMYWGGRAAESDEEQ